MGGNRKNVSTTRSAALLLEYKQMCDDKVIELRKEACEWAAKAREIEKLIPEEMIQEVAEQKQADDHWSMHNGGLVALLENNAKSL